MNGDERARTDHLGHVWLAWAAFAGGNNAWKIIDSDDRVHLVISRKRGTDLFII